MELPAAMAQRIKSTPLTAKESLVAEYILNHFSSVCYVSTSELARILHVSDTTVSRTSKALGYASFLALQKEVRDFVLERADYPKRGFLPPFERLQTHRSLDVKEDVFQQFSALTCKNLQSVLEKNSEETIRSAADLLADSRVKFIVGRRPTAALAGKFAFLLRMVAPRVVEATGDVTVEQLLDIGPDDCLLMINFNPYGAYAERWLSSARERGARIILLTDRPSAPHAGLADILLLTDVYSVSFFNSNVAAMFLLELLVSLIADREGAAAARRLDTLNPYILQNSK